MVQQLRTPKELPTKELLFLHNIQVFLVARPASPPAVGDLAERSEPERGESIRPSLDRSSAPTPGSALRAVADEARRAKPLAASRSDVAPRRSLAKSRNRENDVSAAS
jgi:hypothetical protein